MEICMSGPQTGTGVPIPNPAVPGAVPVPLTAFYGVVAGAATPAACGLRTAAASAPPVTATAASVFGFARSRNKQGIKYVFD